MSQAPGLSGTPEAGHFSSAATSASCASSSARPTSRVMRASAATIFADSMRQIASTVLVATEVGAEPATLAVLGLLLELRAYGGLAGGGLLHVLGEVLELLHLPDLDDLVVGHRGALRPFERVRLGLHPDHPEAADDFLRLG